MTPFLFSIAVAVQLGAQSNEFSGRDGQLSAVPPRFEAPSIVLDAVLDEPEWASAARLTGFTQYTPVEGAAASQETEVRVFYTADAIYFGFHVYDSEPDKILVHLSERDRSQSDDWVRIMLDTYLDEQNAFVFFISPYGIQSDGMWSESIVPRGSPTGPKVDFNPDFLFDSQGQIVEDGWVAEVRIPYVSLRFSDVDVQTWGLQIARGVMRSGFKSSWAPLTTEVSNTLSQSGRLEGLRDLRPRRLVEFNPVATGKLEGARVNDVFERGNAEPEVGLNARIGITSNLVVDATVNPDFSQVEADADQVQVNERFALFFAEKRPFFLEGAEIFRTTQNLVHTRQIIDPIAGAKLTGKVDNFSVAYMGSVDESPSSVFGGTNDAVFNLLRVRGDVGSGSTLGLLYTDRTLTGGGGYNRVLSGDARILFGERYSVESQLTGSWNSTGTPGESVSLQPAVTLFFQRSGLNFRYSAKVEDLDPDFVTRSGFMRRVGDTEARGVLEFDRYARSGAFVERLGLALRTNNFFRHEDFWDGKGPFEWEMEVAPEIAFRDGRSLTTTLGYRGFEFQPEDYASYEVVGPGGVPEPYPSVPALRGMLGVTIRPSFRFNDVWRLSGSVIIRETPLFAEGALGSEKRFGPSLNFRPNDALNVNLNYTWARLKRSDDGSVFSTVSISRVQTQYQFSRTLFVRLIGQYDLEERDALRHPVTGQAVLRSGTVQAERERGNFQAQMLMSLEPSPGTVFFLGYSRVMDGPFGYELSRKDLLQDGFFVKLSYLFRM